MELLKSSANSSRVSRTRSPASGGGLCRDVRGSFPPPPTPNAGPEHARGAGRNLPICHLSIRTKHGTEERTGCPAITCLAIVVV